MSRGVVRAPVGGRAGADLDYAGDIAPGEAWRLLSEDPSAVLVDVRTQAEWTFIGIPDLTAAGKRTVLVSWQFFPDMVENPQFAAELADQGVTAENTVVFMCRTDNRSGAAAREMTARGFTRCLRMTEGFEGPLDGSKHRGTVGGWKARGLPWVQG